MVEKKKVKKQPDWLFTNKRKEALKKAQKTHVILVRIGKRYRNKAIANARLRKIVR